MFSNVRLLNLSLVIVERSHIFNLRAAEKDLSPAALVAGFTRRSFQIERTPRGPPAVAYYPLKLLIWKFIMIFFRKSGGLKCKELENSGDYVVSKDYTRGRLSNVNTLLAEVFFLI